MSGETLQPSSGLCVSPFPGPGWGVEGTPFMAARNPPPIPCSPPLGCTNPTLLDLWQIPFVMLCVGRGGGQLRHKRGRGSQTPRLSAGLSQLQKWELGWASGF